MHWKSQCQRGLWRHLYQFTASFSTPLTLSKLQYPNSHRLWDHLVDCNHDYVSKSLHSRFEFSLNAFTEFSKISDKNICTENIVWTCYLLCKRPRCYHRVSKIFKLTPIHASVIYQIPWIHWISIPFWETPLLLINHPKQPAHRSILHRIVLSLSLSLIFCPCSQCELDAYLTYLQETADGIACMQGPVPRAQNP